MNLHNQLLDLRAKEKQITSAFLEVLQKVENTRGYLQMGYSSLFDYLVRGFGYSESSAYQRQSCLRLSRELPEIKEKIEAGKLSYSTLSLVYKSVKNKSSVEKREVLQQIENKSTREVKKLLLKPAPPIKIKQQHYKDKVVLRLELSLAQHEKLLKLKALKSHGHNMESLLESLIDKELKKFEVSDKRGARNKSPNRVLKYKLNSFNTNDKIIEGKKLGGRKMTGGKMMGRGELDYKKSELKEQKKFQGFMPIRTSNPRYVSRRLRNVALKEANFSCQYPGCDADHYLQIDHKIPVRKGGLAIRENLQVLCSAHNQMKG